MQALSPQSPQALRRGGTSEEKRLRDAIYRVEVKQFGDILKGLAVLFNAIASLNGALGQAGKGAFLEFKDPGTPGRVIPFNRKHLRATNSMFTKLITGLKNYLRVSKRKTRDPVLPEHFRGTYIPVYAGDSLRDFFTKGAAGFGPLHPLTARAEQDAGIRPEALMSYLPMVQQGFLQRNTATMLFFIYAHNNGLQWEQNAQFARADQIMVDAFGGIIAASFFSFFNGEETASGEKKISKIPMQQAIDQKMIDRPWNEFEIITSLYPPGQTFNKKGEDVGFRIERFNTYYYQNIAAGNYYSKPTLLKFPQFEQIAAFLDEPENRRSMLAEHTLVKEVSLEWLTILGPGRKARSDLRKKQNDARKKRERDAQKAMQ